MDPGTGCARPADQALEQIELAGVPLASLEAADCAVVERRQAFGVDPAEAIDGPTTSRLRPKPMVGARTVRSLAMVADVIHGAPCRFADPARFSLSHGAKTGSPFRR